MSETVLVVVAHSDDEGSYGWNHKKTLGTWRQGLRHFHDDELGSRNKVKEKRICEKRLLIRPVIY